MGTTRLAVGFGAGFIGILYLTVALTPLASGKITIWPAPWSLDSPGPAEFPESQYLEATDGYVVFQQSHVHMEKAKDSPPTLKRLTTPIIGSALLKKWQADTANDELPDATKLRLLASFEPEQVARLWPEVIERVSSGQPLDLPPVQMTLTGETVLGKHIVFKPYDIQEQTVSMDWDSVRLLKFEDHFNSPGRFLKNLLIGLALLLLSLQIFGFHRRRPDAAARKSFDWSSIPRIQESAEQNKADEDTDVDIDVSD